MATLPFGHPGLVLWRSSGIGLLASVSLGVR
ncbi:hypothetical protein JOD54_004119 [Actinokineospora baliensis]|nr:hypothetical protein [Actinokineospora baliensis]